MHLWYKFTFLFTSKGQWVSLCHLSDMVQHLQFINIYHLSFSLFVLHFYLLVCWRGCVPQAICKWPGGQLQSRSFTFFICLSFHAHFFQIICPQILRQNTWENSAAAFGGKKRVSCSTANIVYFHKQSTACLQEIYFSAQLSICAAAFGGKKRVSCSTAELYFSQTIICLSAKNYFLFSLQLSICSVFFLMQIQETSFCDTFVNLFACLFVFWR